MNEPDAELMRLLASNDPPARDLDFELKVATRLQKRRLSRDAMDWILAGLVSAIALWAAGPWLFRAFGALLGALGAAAPLVVATAGTGLALALAWSIPDAFEWAPPRD